MALTDPVNVTVGDQRRKQLIQRLAQQMAASSRGGFTGVGSVQGVGRPFNNAVDLRAAATPALSLDFQLPDDRIRPAGFDPTNQVISSGPPGLGGGVGIGDAQTNTQPALSSAAPTPVTTTPTTSTPNPTLPIDANGFNSDTPLNTPAPTTTPAASVTPPDPYTVMMQRIMALKLAQFDAQGNNVGGRIPGLQY